MWEFEVRTIHTGLCSLPYVQRGALEEQEHQQGAVLGSLSPRAPPILPLQLTAQWAPLALCPPPGTYPAPPAWPGSPFTASSSLCCKLTAWLRGECSLSPTLGCPPCESCGPPSTSGAQIHLLPPKPENVGHPLFSQLPQLPQFWGYFPGERTAGGRPPVCQEKPRTVPGSRGWPAPVLRRHSRCSKKAFQKG